MTSKDLETFTLQESVDKFKQGVSTPEIAWPQVSLMSKLGNNFEYFVYDWVGSFILVGPGLSEARDLKMNKKYTIRSIVCEAFCHPVI